MKKLVQAFLFFNILSSVIAQPITFSKVFYDSLQIGIQVKSVVSSFDNGFILAGTHNYNNGFILKIDSAGNSLWNKAIGNSEIISINCITSTQDSSFAIVGSIYENGNTNALIIKINAIGDTIWSKSISQNGSDLTTLFVQCTNDSGFVITGFAYSTIPNEPNNKIFVAKFKSIGILQWFKIYSGANNSNIGYSIKQTLDSGFMVTGYMENNPPFDPNAFLLKLTPSGDIAWSKKYNLTSSVWCSGNDIQILNDGFLCFLNVNYYSTLIKTDFLGNILWSKSINMFSGNSTNSPSQKINKLSDGGFVIISNGCGGGTCTDGSILKMDSLGDLVWIKMLHLGSADVVETTDRGLFIVGNGPLSGIKAKETSSPQIGIIKTDSLGIGNACIYDISGDIIMDSLVMSSINFISTSGGTITSIYPNISSVNLLIDSGCVAAFGSINENESNNSISISPNPSPGIFSFTHNLQSQTSNLTIYNIFGEIIYFLPNTEYRLPITIDISHNPSGIYFCTLQTGDEIISKKIILTK